MEAAEAFNVAIEAMVTRACGHHAFVLRDGDARVLSLRIQIGELFLGMQVAMDDVVAFESKADLVAFLSKEAVKMVTQARVDDAWKKLEESKRKAVAR